MDNIANNNLVSNLPEERGWEYKQINVTRVAGYGFGIAVSGGRDNPHFASGDPSIAVSDVLASGPAERLLQVNDRIISVNGISLQNVDYATAVQVLRDSGDTVSLVVKRRTTQHHHSHSLSASYTGTPLAALGINPLPTKVTLTKNSKKEDFGIVLGCKLFIKEISSKARDQLLQTNQVLNEGDFIVKLHNTNCNDTMSLKEAKKIMDGCKDKIHITVQRDRPPNNVLSHQTQSSISTTGAVNNFYKGDDFLTAGQSYSNQNLYVQPPTRNPNLNPSSTFDDKIEINTGPSSLPDDKSNLAPRGRSRGPLSEAHLTQQDNRNNASSSYGRSSKSREEPPRPPPPRAEDFYGTRRQIYEEDPIIQKTKQPIPDARFITFHKEGSVGIRLTGGNFVGIFVTAVQPGSPASLQGLQPGDKILKVNDMDMTGVTREEAVLFLLSLQDRIELIVQFCKEEYDSIVASQKGDSFYIKTHFHYENPAKGEMSFRSGDIFHVIDTLYNGVVGCWQVFRIGRNNQEVQKGIIPNKARAEELATAQFNATKKEMSSNESRGSFFRRRRSSNRRSKSLGKEHWDDILFSDTVSKFPAYERVLLKHPPFTRPVIMFGPIADVARDKLLKDFPDKFISPQLDPTSDDHGKGQKASSNIIRLSAIRDVISTGKHAILDITPNAVERLNYAQLYPIVVFFKAETKIVIKQLRQGLPKSAHKSSKKLLEQCQKLDKVWSHIFSATITLNDNTDNWYRKVREIIDKQQSGALWISESKPEESLSDDFLFPMSSLRLSYASSPESDLEHSPGPPVSPTGGHSGAGSSTGGRLTKASSDPSVVMNEPSTTDTLPPYQPTYDTRYGFSQQQNEPQTPSNSSLNKEQTFSLSSQDIQGALDEANAYNKSNIYGSRQDYQDAYPKVDPRGSTEFPSERSDFNNDRRNEFTNDRRNEFKSEFNNIQHKRQPSTLHGPYNHSKGHSLSEQSPRRSPSKENVYGQGPPDLPPRVDRAVKPMGLLTTPSKIPNGRSAHERLFGTKAAGQQQENGDQNANESGNFNKLGSGSLERSQNSKSDSLSSYDSFSKQGAPRGIGPNAHDDLKTTLSKIESINPPPPPISGSASAHSSPSKYNPAQRWQGSKLDLKYGLPSLNNNDGGDGAPVDSDKNHSPMDNVSPRGSIERDMYRYSRSPAKQATPSKQHMETKTDYGKYSRNNSSAQDYQHQHQRVGSQHDLTGIPQHLSVHQHQSSQLHNSSAMKNHYHHQQQPPPSSSNATGQTHQNGYDSGLLGTSNGTGGYKPVPPPKPKNYKPPYKGQQQQYGGEGMMPPYQHSHINSQDQQQQRSMLGGPGGGASQQPMNYYYNMPAQPVSNSWHNEGPMRYPSAGIHGSTGHYEPSRRHPSISYASRSEIAPIAPPSHDNYMDGADLPDTRPSLVDLQGSREQRGSAFELYRKPLHHNLRFEDPPHSNPYGSQPNILQKLNSSTNSPKVTTKLTKTQSFKHQRSEGFAPKLFRKWSFRSKSSQEGTPKPARKSILTYSKMNESNIVRQSPTGCENYGMNDIYERLPRDLNRNTPERYMSTPERMRGTPDRQIGTPERFRSVPSTPIFDRRQAESIYGTNKIYECSIRDMNRNNPENIRCTPERLKANSRDVTSKVIDHRGGKLVNEYWGVCLEIPEGAFPKGLRKEIYFVVSDPRVSKNVPPLDLENGETMLSPLVMCGPQGTEFLKPVILTIPHYANTLPSLGISLKATDSEQNVYTDWDNILLPSNHAANRVTVKVDHF